MDAAVTVKNGSGSDPPPVARLQDIRQGLVPDGRALTMPPRLVAELTAVHSQQAALEERRAGLIRGYVLGQGVDLATHGVSYDLASGVCSVEVLP